MATRMSRYINTDALEVVGFTNREGSFSDGVQWLLEYIDGLPSADVQPVTQCKYCKHSTEWYGDKRRCFLWCEDGIDVFEDGFCNYWDRKDGEQDES